MYKEFYDELKQKGFTIKLHVLDNEASNALKCQITENDTEFQLFEAYNHRTNVAEKGIRTFKNHFIAGLASTDPNFSMFLWHHLLKQAEITLNLLRSSQTHPQLSAYAHLYGHYDYNKNPLAPLGTKVVLFEDPKTQLS